MSIVAAIKVYDGVVLGADSATTITGSVIPGNQQIVKSYQNAQKIFQIADLKVGVLTYGLGNIGNRSMASIISEFSKKIRKDGVVDIGVKKVAEMFFEYIRDIYQEAFKNVTNPTPIPVQGQFQLGFYIGGYSDDNPLASEWEFVLPGDKTIRKVRDENQFGASWRGQSLPFFRLHMGFDPRILDVLTQKFKLPVEEVAKIAKNFETKVQYVGMPLQDAVDFMEYILKTTINYSKFEIGIPVCSEPIDIAVITTKGFTSIKYKQLNF
ncbi:MAG: hypothetical protein JST87_01560 [Bacteroidetes bacterium]|nr:hypothetical protein [Bacteroidota bacterium]